MQFHQNVRVPEGIATRYRVGWLSKVCVGTAGTNDGEAPTTLASSLTLQGVCTLVT